MHKPRSALFLAMAAALSVVRETPKHIASVKGFAERTFRRVRNLYKRRIGSSRYTPHQGKKETAKWCGRAQFPEYLKLEARNLASGKWVRG